MGFQDPALTQHPEHPKLHGNQVILTQSFGQKANDFSFRWGELPADYALLPEPNVRITTEHNEVTNRIPR
jgi:hypothetical protein